MEWVKELIAKLPTLKGSSYFIYVASHWGRISAEIEEYRRRVQDQKEWHEESERLLTKIHQRGIEDLTSELRKETEEKSAIEQEAMVSEALADRVLNLYSKAITHLAVISVLNPVLWVIGRKSLDPEVRELVEKVAEKMKADLPPAPPPPIVPRGIFELK